MKNIENVSIIGMGALGMLYGDLISNSLGNNVITYVADPERVEKYHKMNFSINGNARHFPITSSNVCAPADLVIVAVKYTALSDALETMKNCIGPDTIIISVINGIISEEILGKCFGYDKIIYCIAQGMDAVKFNGSLTYTKIGELRIGIRPVSDEGKILSANQQKLDTLKQFLLKANIPYMEEKDIMYRLWGKFMLNVGINQVCMAFETNYGGALKPGKPFDTMIGAMQEVILIANAEGIPLSQKDMDSYIDLLHTLSPEGLPSMRQDGLAHRPSEVEIFSGTVIKIAEKHHIPVPVNEWLYHKIKKMEASH